MNTLTIQEFQNHFEDYIDKVESGQSFLIKSKNGDVMLVPYNQHYEVDELVRIHIDHEEGS